MIDPHPPKTVLDRVRAGLGDRALRTKVLSFGLIGVVNSVIDYGVFVFGYYYLHLTLVPANILAWLVAVSASYIMNSTITFAAESGRRLRLRDYATFVVSGIAGVIGNTATLVLASYVLPVLIAKLLAIGVSFVVNFSLSHFVVFRPRKAPVGAAGQASNDASSRA
jgi:putative flippase GtrA